MKQVKYFNKINLIFVLSLILFNYLQACILICLVGLSYGGLVKREAEAGLAHGHGLGLGHGGVAVSPVAHDTQCHTEYDTITTQACNTVPEQVCNTVTDFRSPVITFNSFLFLIFCILDQSKSAMR